MKNKILLTFVAAILLNLCLLRTAKAQEIVEEQEKPKSYSGMPIEEAAFAAFKDKNYTESIKYFSKLSQNHPLSSSALYNLGVAYLENKQLGFAIHSWRSAVHKNPEAKDSFKALSFVLSKNPQLNVNQLTSIGAFYHSIRKWNFIYCGLGFLIFLLLFGRSLVIHLGQIKKALDQESSRPSVSFKVIGYGLAVCIAFTLLSLKLMHSTEQEATITVRKAQLHISPSKSSPSLLELGEGDLVKVIQAKDSWVQIKIFDGNKAWVQKTQLATH